MNVPANSDADSLYEAFVAWVQAQGLELYEHQDEAITAIMAGEHAIVSTPTGSGKTLIGTAAHFAALANGRRSYYTAPIKALVNEKFFALAEIFGADKVGMVTGDAAVNPDAPIIACTAEIVANIALRAGRDAEVGQVVTDEFHFIADPDRGWAWQVALTELPQAQFVIMSATLGDATELAAGLVERSGRPAAIIANAERPVPLTYRWATTPIHDTVADLIYNKQAPVYIVHASQAAAQERAQSLLSSNLVNKEQRAEIVAAMGHFRFAPGYGQTLAKLLRAGIGVHHAGMLPKYRRLVETLAQAGLLPVISGTDTLGVGINVPIRTVLLTSLTKFDGRRTRVLKAREFHQIAGRAGRAGFDQIGYVVAQAPDHVVENERLVAKAGDDPKKLKRVQRKKPPEGFVNYTEATFERLIEAPPEPLHPRMRVTTAMLINLLSRDEDTVVALKRIIDDAVPNPANRRKLYRRGLALGRTLVTAGIVVPRDVPTAGGRKFDLHIDLQDNFALNQPLSAFALAAIDLLDPEYPDYASDVVSVIEATLEDPYPVLKQQAFYAKGEAVAELKAEGFDYEERMAALEDVTHPKPLNDLLEHAFETFASSHPWIRESPVSPKSVVNDIWDRAMTFGEYVAHYKVQRSEGLVLRYLSDAYRALRQTVPEAKRTEDLIDRIEWLGEIVRMTDSSLLDEWESLANPTEQVVAATAVAPLRPLTGNRRAFRVLVRNAMFRRVELAADDDVDGLAALGDDLDPDAWDAALGDYWDDYEEIGTDAAARGPALFVIEGEETRSWRVRQIISDPDGNHDWSMLARVDLDASDESGELALRVAKFGRS